VTAALASARRLVLLALAQRRLAAAFVAASLIRAAMATAVVLLTQQFLTGVLAQGGGPAAELTRRVGGGSALWVVAGLLLACHLVAGVAGYAVRVSEQRILRGVELRILDRVIAHLLTLSMDFFERRSQGDLVQAVRQDTTKSIGVLSSSARLVVEVLQAAALFAAAAWISPRLMLLACVTVPPVLLPMIWLARRAYRTSFQVRRHASHLFDGLLQILRGMRLIRVYQREASERLAAGQRAERYFAAAMTITRAEATSDMLLESAAAVAMAVVIIGGGAQVLAGALTWPSLLAFMLAVRALQTPVSNANAHLLAIQRQAASLVRIEELLATRPSVVERPDARPLTARPRTLAFSNVAFGYDGTPVLAGLEVSVAAGEVLGIAGPSGAGKSTLLALAARLIDPTAGVVSLDGHDLRELRLADLYRHCALVPQEPFVFAASVRDNIRCGRPEASEAEVLAAARAAEIHDEIVDLPDAYDTIVGPGGRGLSDGQAQRLNVARALLKDPALLLLDEASSSLDALAEARMQRALDGLARGRMTVVVAHRLATLRRATRILVLDRGVAVGLGTHDELLRGCPLYRDMWDTQHAAALGPPLRA
jgi:ABC-type multidrug transport system fused ATPase/permease subunit